MFIPPLRIALSGGGMKGLAHIGALEVLQERGLLSSVKEYIGISAGAFCAFCLCIGCTITELREIVTRLDFGVIRSLEPESCFQFPETFGLDDGANVARFLEVLLKNKGFSATTTFAELAAVRPSAPSLRVYATDLNRCSHAEFSAAVTPDYEIRTAVRASMTIPIYFTPVKDPITGNLLVDGGLITHFPFYLLSPEEKAHTLGITFSFQHKIRAEVDSFLEYLKQMYFAYDFKEMRELEQAWPDHIAHLPCGGFPSIHFEASKAERDALVQAGRDGMAAFLERRRRQLPPRRFSVA